MISLTPRQAEVKRFIGDYTKRNGRSPMFQEIADGLGLASKSTAFNAVDELVVRGHAVRTKAASRNIQLLHKPVSETPLGEPLYFVPIGGAK
ncbi:MAG: hypothetical protein AAGE86_03920 [Pseudomonadota bacterium]